MVNDGILTLSRTTVIVNDAAGIVNWAGSLTLPNSRIGHNGNRGIRNEKGTVTLDASTISDNLGLGDLQSGGGIYNGSGVVILNNSTVSGNASTFEAAGIHIGGNGLLILNDSTVSNNHAKRYAGDISVVMGTSVLRNSLLAENTVGGDPSDCTGNLTSADYNLIGSTSGCAFTGAAGDLLAVDPRLDSLIGPPGAKVIILS